MPIEVELKVLADNDPEWVYNRLKKKNYAFIQDVREIDYYLDTPDLVLAKGDKAFRVRISRDTMNPVSAEKIEITFKGPKIDKISKTREEFSFYAQGKRVGVILNVFQRLGFSEVFEINKTRSLWQHPGGTLISVDLVDQLAPDCYVEAELASENPNDRKKLIQELMKLLKELLDCKGALQSEKRSYLELAINRRQIVI